MAQQREDTVNLEIDLLLQIQDGLPQLRHQFTPRVIHWITLMTCESHEDMTSPRRRIMLGVELVLS